MSFIGTAKAATIVLTLGIGAAGGGLGLGYAVQNNSFGVFRERHEKEPVVVPADPINNAEKDSSNPNQKDLKSKASEPKISFDAEVIYGKSHGNICKGWAGKVVGDPKIMDDAECQKKIQSNWPEENSSQQPGIWLKASEENAVLFFVKYWGLSKEKQQLLKKDNKEKWTSLSWECTNKKDLEDGEKIIVSCNSTVTQSNLRK